MKHTNYITADGAHCLVRDYYGMSTSRGQKDFGGIGNKMSEGSEKPVKITGTIKDTLAKITTALASAMSYTNSRTLYDFTDVLLKVMTPDSFRVYTQSK